MIEVNPANPIFLAQFQPVIGKCQFALQNRRSFISDSVNHSARAVLVIVNLTPGPLKEAVVVKELESPKDLLRTAGNQRAEMVGAQKPMTMNVFEDFPVAFGQPEPGDVL